MLRPITIVTLLVALAFAPLAIANAAPVPVAQVQASAVLNEPVVFTSASFDPDGTIVATSWESSSDGRIRNGATVTIAFEFAALHTITLRVRDDAGAISQLDVQLLVQAPLMQGRATALRAGDTTAADTGDVSTEQHTATVEPLGEVTYGALRFAALDADLRTHSDRAVARADVGSLYIPVPIGYVLITGIEAEAIVGCGFPTIVNSKFTQVRLNDAPLVPPGDVPANTRVAIPGGPTLTLNAQDAPAADRLGVTAVRVEMPDGSVIEVAHAEAGVSHCPFV